MILVIIGRVHNFTGTQ